MTGISVGILAGGQSRRMGQDKAFLPIGGRPVIERVIERVAPLTDDLVLITNNPDKYRHLGQRMVSDRIPGKGALGGIHTAVHVASHTYCLVVACDMPFLNSKLLRYLAGLASGFDVVVPCIEGFPETLHAIYGKACLEPIESCLRADSLKIVSFFGEVHVRYVERAEVAQFDPRFQSFLNMNTPADWEQLRRLAGGHQAF